METLAGRTLCSRAQKFYGIHPYAWSYCSAETDRRNFESVGKMPL